MIPSETYRERIRLIHKSLGIPKDYESIFQIPLQVEATDLIFVENDVYDRPRQLAVPAAEKWHEMKSAAAAENVPLRIVSAFRSVEYQSEMIRAKLSEGQNLLEILATVAAPGFSEHHTGRAVDICSSAKNVLTEEFEKTDSFAWLVENAARFAFRLSYPKDAQSKIDYEPWHWAYCE